MVVVRTRKPWSPSAVVVCTTASGSPASLNAVRICSVLTSPVLWNDTDVPPTNSMPKFSPFTPTMASDTHTSTAATPKNTRRWPRKLMSCLMNLPCGLRAARAAASPAAPSARWAASSDSAALMASPASAAAVLVPSAAASAA